MTAPELLMSESQERMMAFVEPSLVDDVLEVAHKWEIDARVVGTVNSGDILRIRHQGEVVAEIPAASLSEAAPRYDRPLAQPAWLEDTWNDTLEHAPPTDLAAHLLTLLDDPTIASADWVSEQYDHMLFLNTVVGPGDDGTLLRLQGTNKGLAVSTDGNGRLCYLDPFRGGERLVYEAALNVAMVGASPMAVVDNLNFGNPEKPEVMWQFRQCIEGISAACEHLGIPVIGGNVSFYNETDGVDIHPTPIVGLLGKAEPMPVHPPRLNAARPGMDLWLFGSDDIDLAASSFERVIHGHLGGRPLAADPEIAKAVLTLAVSLAGSGIAPVLHDISDGGLAVAVAEVCVRSGVGVTVEVDDWRQYFSEAPHRFIAAVHPDKSGSVATMAEERGVAARRIGDFSGHTIALHSDSAQGSTTVSAARSTYFESIPSRMR